MNKNLNEKNKRKIWTEIISSKFSWKVRTENFEQNFCVPLDLLSNEHRAYRLSTLWYKTRMVKMTSSYNRTVYDYMQDRGYIVVEFPYRDILLIHWYLIRVEFKGVPMSRNQFFYYSYFLEHGFYWIWFVSNQFS